MISVIVLTLLGLVFGIGLGYAAIHFRVEGNPLEEQIDAILPQTQCGQCGYPGCRPYAQAIAAEQAEINQCPPGGEAGVQALADLLGREPLPLNPENGPADDGTPMVAVINEDTCIGCTKCMQVCPVDAIAGAAKHIHAVLNDYCTGCKLCIPPLCPVEDCIVMQPVDISIAEWHLPIPEASRMGAAA